MTAKQLVLDFYKNDLLLHKSEVTEFLHEDLIIEWNSSKGYVQMKREEILALANELSKAYVRSKVRISHLLKEGNMITVRYSHYIKTIENPREEMLLAHFMVIWEVKDGKLFRGYQMSQIS